MPEVESLEQRVRVLERHNRSLRWTVLLSLVLALLGLLWGRVWPANGTVEARSFVVADASGRVRGSFGADQSGVGLNLQDAEGHWRAGLLVDDAGRPGLFLLDTAAQPVVSLLLQQGGAPFLRLRTPDDSASIQLRVGTGAARGVFVMVAGDTASLTPGAGPPAH